MDCCREICRPFRKCCVMHTDLRLVLLVRWSFKLSPPVFTAFLMEQLDCICPLVIARIMCLEDTAIPEAAVNSPSVTKALQGKSPPRRCTQSAILGVGLREIVLEGVGIVHGAGCNG